MQQSEYVIRPVAQQQRAADVPRNHMNPFLEFCVSTGEMEPLFIQLVDEYRDAPTISKAVALYDIFCAPCAPAKLSAGAALPPHDMQIEHAMRRIKLNWTRMQAAFVFGPTTHICTAPPPRLLFDALASHIAESKSFRKIRRQYHAWLSDGSSHLVPLDDFQQHFVDKIWQPIIRPHLLAAGFFDLPAASAAAA